MSITFNVLQSQLFFPVSRNLTSESELTILDFSLNQNCCQASATVCRKFLMTTSARLQHLIVTGTDGDESFANIAVNRQSGQTQSAARRLCDRGAFCDVRSLKTFLVSGKHSKDLNDVSKCDGCNCLIMSTVDLRRAVDGAVVDHWL